MEEKKRIDSALEAYGETLLINGVTSAKGFFQQLDQARMSMYFDSIEQSSILRPALIVLVSGDTPAATGNTVTRDGRTYTVAKMSRQRLRDVVVLLVLVLT